MGGEAKRHAKYFYFVEHRGFSLDLLQLRLNPDSFRNSFERQVIIMTGPGLEVLQAEIEATDAVRWIGRITEIKQGAIRVAGLSGQAALGDMVAFSGSAGSDCVGEIVQLDASEAVVMPDGNSEGVQIGARVELLGQNQISPHDNWIGRIIDPFGKPLDGEPLLRGIKPRSLRGIPINPTERRPLGARLETGMAVFNTMLPIVRGQRLGLFAGSGVGKSTLLGKLATGLDADLVVIAMIGERGRELREFIERVLGPEGMSRAIIVAATSDQSAFMRRRCAWTAMSVAEHFRDAGRHVLFLADSVTRFAEAHREIALASGEPGTLRGYPPSTAHQITQLCERAGPGFGNVNDITAVFSVLVAGSDMEEPIADIMRGVLDGHVVLDRKIAERGRFPAIDLLKSVSRALPFAASAEENETIVKARALLGTYERNEMMIQAGLYTAGADAAIDAAIAAWPLLDHFLAESEIYGIGASFARLSSCIAMATDDHEDSHPDESSV
jgi:flagellum-specific ATP synthase